MYVNNNFFLPLFPSFSVFLFLIFFQIPRGVSNPGFDDALSFKDKGTL